MFGKDEELKSSFKPKKEIGERSILPLTALNTILIKLEELKESESESEVLRLVEEIKNIINDNERQATSLNNFDYEVKVLTLLYLVRVGNDKLESMIQLFNFNNHKTIDLFKLPKTVLETIHHLLPNFLYQIIVNDGHYVDILTLRMLNLCLKLVDNYHLDSVSSNAMNIDLDSPYSFKNIADNTVIHSNEAKFNRLKNEVLDSHFHLKKRHVNAIALGYASLSLVKRDAKYVLDCYELLVKLANLGQEFTDPLTFLILNRYIATNPYIDRYNLTSRITQLATDCGCKFTNSQQLLPNFLAIFPTLAVPCTKLVDFEVSSIPPISQSDVQLLVQRTIQLQKTMSLFQIEHCDLTADLNLKLHSMDFSSLYLLKLLNVKVSNPNFQLKYFTFAFQSACTNPDLARKVLHLYLPKFQRIRNLIQYDTVAFDNFLISIIKCMVACNDPPTLINTINFLAEFQLSSDTLVQFRNLPYFKVLNDKVKTFLNSNFHFTTNSTLDLELVQTYLQITTNYKFKAGFMDLVEKLISANYFKLSKLDRDDKMYLNLYVVDSLFNFNEKLKATELLTTTLQYVEELNESVKLKLPQDILTNIRDSLNNVDGNNFNIKVLDTLIYRYDSSTVTEE